MNRRQVAKLLRFIYLFLETIIAFYVIKVFVVANELRNIIYVIVRLECDRPRQIVRLMANNAVIKRFFSLMIGHVLAPLTKYGVSVMTQMLFRCSFTLSGDQVA